MKVQFNISWSYTTYVAIQHNDNNMKLFGAEYFKCLILIKLDAKYH